MPNAFLIKKHDPRLNPIVWDKYYIDRELKKVAKKTGEGEEDYVLVCKVVETKRSIKETIESQADDVGLENILKKFALTGDESVLPERAVSDGQVFDMTQLPQDLVDVHNFMEKQKAMFESLPADLVKGRSFEEFMSNINQNEFQAWLAAVAAANAPKQEVKEEGDK